MIRFSIISNMSYKIYGIIFRENILCTVAKVTGTNQKYLYMMHSTVASRLTQFSPLSQNDFVR